MPEGLFAQLYKMERVAELFTIYPINNFAREYDSINSTNSILLPAFLLIFCINLLPVTVAYACHAALFRLAAIQ
jgi:hypothetical protein